MPHMFTTHATSTEKLLRMLARKVQIQKMQVPNLALTDMYVNVKI